MEAQHVNKRMGKHLASMHYPTPYGRGEFIINQQPNYYVAIHKLGDTILAHWKSIGQFPQNK